LSNQGYINFAYEYIAKREFTKIASSGSEEEYQELDNVLDKNMVISKRF
jgi:hypothetical protein